MTCIENDAFEMRNKALEYSFSYSRNYLFEEKIRLLPEHVVKNAEIFLQFLQNRQQHPDTAPTASEQPSAYQPVSASELPRLS